MTIPPLLVFAAGLALVLFIGGTMAGLHSLRRRVKALEADESVIILAEDMDRLREEVRTLQNS